MLRPRQSALSFSSAPTNQRSFLDPNHHISDSHAIYQWPVLGLFALLLLSLECAHRFSARVFRLVTP